MASQLIECPTARKLLSGPGKGPGCLQTLLRPSAVVCPVPRCQELIDASRLLCRRDWQLVPKRLRDRIWRTWRSGHRPGSFAHHLSVRLAIAACVVRRATD
jgi:hypothetical protein